MILNSKIRKKFIIHSNTVASLAAYLKIKFYTKLKRALNFEFTLKKHNFSTFIFVFHIHWECFHSFLELENIIANPNAENKSACFYPYVLVNFIKKSNWHISHLTSKWCFEMLRKEEVLEKLSLQLKVIILLKEVGETWWKVAKVNYS